MEKETTIENEFRRVEKIYEDIVAFESILKYILKAKREGKSTLPIEYANICFEEIRFAKTFSLDIFPIIRIDENEIKNILYELQDNFNLWGGIEKFNRCKNIYGQLYALIALIDRMNIGKSIKSHSDIMLFYDRDEKQNVSISINSKYFPLQIPPKEMLILQYKELRKELLALLNVKFYESDIDKNISTQPYNQPIKKTFFKRFFSALTFDSWIIIFVCVMSIITISTTIIIMLKY